MAELSFETQHQKDWDNIPTAKSVAQSIKNLSSTEKSLATHLITCARELVECEQIEIAKHEVKELSKDYSIDAMKLLAKFDKFLALSLAENFGSPEPNGISIKDEYLQEMKDYLSTIERTLEEEGVDSQKISVQPPFKIEREITTSEEKEKLIKDIDDDLVW